MILPIALSLVVLLLPGPVFHICGGVSSQVPHIPLILPNTITITWSLETTELSVRLLMSSCGTVINSFTKLRLWCIFVLKRCFTSTEITLDIMKPNTTVNGSSHNMKRRIFILLLLLLSGNVQPNPGPVLNNITTPEVFRARTGLGLIHLNIRSLLPKLDAVKIWIESTNADILILSETWLNKTVSDKDIAINGYNIFRCDRPRKGGGVAIYIKSRFHVTLFSSLSIVKQFELLALKLDFFPWSVSHNYRLLSTPFCLPRSSCLSCFLHDWV